MRDCSWIRAFLTQLRPPEFSETLGYSSPSSKAISFNGQIRHQDGLLTNHLVQKYQLSYTDAVGRIESFVKEFNDRLEDYKSFELKEIGSFYLTAEAKTIFVPYYALNFEIRSYGLPKLRVKKLNVEPKTTIDKKPEPAGPVIPSPPIHPKKKDLQEVLLEEKVSSQRQQSRKKRNLVMAGLNSLAILGFAFMAFALIQFEMNGQGVQTAALLQDTVLSIDTVDMSQKQQKYLPALPKLEVHRICSQPFHSTEDASKFLTQIKDKYQFAEVISYNNSYVVSVISFTNRQLASEYLELINPEYQNQLTIKTE